MSEVGTKQLQAAARESFGWTAQEITSRLCILNEQGDTRVIRASDGIRANYEIGSIPGRFWLATPGGKIKNSPSFKGPSNFPKAVTWNYTPDPETGGEKAIAYTVTITNYLTPLDPPLSYSVEADYERGILTSPEDVKREYAKDAFKWDYHAVKVTFPVERLTVAVDFKVDLDIKTFPGVFYGHERHHDLEFQRVRNGFSSSPDGYKSTFTIEQPKLGFEYLIYWELPG